MLMPGLDQNEAENIADARPQSGQKRRQWIFHPKYCRRPASIGMGQKNHRCCRGPSFDHLSCRQLPRTQGPIGRPLSIWWCGMRGGLGALSLSRWRRVFVYLWHYGRNLGQILRDYQRWVESPPIIGFF